MRELLMIPGPVEIPQDIIDAYSCQSPAHYGSNWTEFYLNLISRISKIFHTTGKTFLMPGSGSLGLESAASTFCSGKKCLILNNGWFGKRLVSIISAHTSECRVLNFEADQGINLSKLEKEMKCNRYDVVISTHVETSTGVLNPIKNIASIAKSNGSMMIVDAVSSATLEELNMDSWGIDVIVSASQKGFECPPGIAIVTLSENAEKAIQKCKVNSWYTNLSVWMNYCLNWHDWHPFPVTLPTNIILAIGKSVELIEQEGLEKRIQRIARTSERFKKALRVLGFELFAPKCQHANGLTAVKSMKKIDATEIVSFLKTKFNIRIAGSLGDLKGKVFRIGHMSRKQTDVKNLSTVIVAIGSYLKLKGAEAQIAEAVQQLLNP